MKKKILVFLLISLIGNLAIAVLPTPLLTAPADASTGNPANTLINWFNVTGATSYEFKLDTSATLVSTPIQTSISSQFLNANLKYGTTYYWQVRALKTTGIADSSAWTQIFSFSTLDQLNLTAPTNGAINQFPKTYLNWSSTGGITNYQAQWDDSPLFNTPNLGDTLLPDSISDVYALHLSFGTTYYWRVRAMHSLDTTEWSTPQTFTVLDTAILSAPANLSAFQSPSVKLDWSYITGITNYQVELDKTPLFNSSFFQSVTLPDSSSEWVPGNLEFAEGYFWRVRAWHEKDTSQWSQTWNFSTLVALTLTSPSDNSVNQFPNVTLNWNFLTAPISYDAEYDTSANFNSPLYIYTSNDSISEYKPSDLLFGTRYFWRARAHNLIDTSQWSQVWNFTTRDMVDLSYPSNGDSGLASRITLDWDAVEGTNGYQVRIDTSSSYSSSVLASFSPGNSSQQVADLYYGTKYYWSVRTFHTMDTSAWSATWAFTTSDQVSLTSPANNSVDVAPRTNLNWSNLTGSAYYIASYDTSANFSSPIVVTDTSNTSNFYTANLYFNQKYYWRAKAVNAVDTSAWSDVWSFTSLNQLTHTSPLDGAISQALTTEINWSGTSGATGYIYRFDTSPLFNQSPQIGTAIGTNSRADINLTQYGQTYYWQVAAIDSADTSAWSSPWSFTTLYQLAVAPVLVSPADLASGLATSAVNLIWNSVPAALSYEYAYSTSNLFGNAIVATSLDTFGLINGLTSFTTYFWRVRALDANGFSPWSTVFSFTTLNPFVSTPILFAPEDLAIDVPQPVVLTWYPLAPATAYSCEYSLDSLFTNPVALAVNDTFAMTAVLNPLTPYYWRVKGIDGNANSAWSSVWSFTSENPLTVAPIQISPANFSLSLGSPVTFTWNAMAFASSFECEYDTDSLFSAPTTLLAIDTTVISLPLTPLASYFWRVRGVIGNASSPWSDVWKFTTENPLVVAPQLVSPANLSVNNNSPVTFVWNALLGAASYECEYSSDSLFTSATTLLANDTSVVSQPLAALSNYFWRVRGVLASVYSPWSSVWKFETSSGTIPSLLFPAQGDTGILSPVNFIWSSLAVATNYECEYDVDSLFTNPVQLSSVTATVTSQNLAMLTKYYWRVRATDGTTAFPWSEVWSFTTSFMVGIYSPVLSNEISIYPNPAQESTYLFGIREMKETTAIDLYASSGALVWSKIFSGPIKENIDLSSFAKGLYTVKITGNNKVIVKKLVHN